VFAEVVGPAGEEQVVLAVAVDDRREDGCVVLFDR